MGYYSAVCSTGKKLVPYSFSSVFKTNVVGLFYLDTLRLQTTTRSIIKHSIFNIQLHITGSPSASCSLASEVANRHAGIFNRNCIHYIMHKVCSAESMPPFFIASLDFYYRVIFCQPLFTIDFYVTPYASIHLWKQLTFLAIFTFSSAFSVLSERAKAWVALSGIQCTVLTR